MKIVSALVIGVVVVMVACGAWVLAAQQKPASADVLLGQALHQEQNEGRLEDAIASYKKVLAAADATREQKARAQFRIGACYERLGAGEARKAYETVVRDFADQSDLVSQAKTRLARLRGGETTTATTRPHIRQVWPDSGGAIWNRISPDSRFVSGADRVTGDLIIRELASGNTQRLTNIPKDRWLLEWACFPVWSQDGRYLAYGWWTQTRPAETPTTQAQFAADLRVADLRDGTTRMVYADARSRVEQVLDWSPDGRSLLYFDDGRRYGCSPAPEEWLQVDIATGAVKKMTLPIETVRQIALSPNGREAAFVVRLRSKDEGVWLMENFLPPTKGKAAAAKK